MAKHIPNLTMYEYTQAVFDSDLYKDPSIVDQMVINLTTVLNIDHVSKLDMIEHFFFGNKDLEKIAAFIAALVEADVCTGTQYIDGICSPEFKEEMIKVK